MSTWLSRFDRRSRPLSEANSAWFNRRVYMLSRHLAQAIPSRGSVLDIGAGDGQIGRALMRLRPDLKVEGADIVPRPRTLIPVAQYDGITLPYADKSVDYVTLVDFLHSTADPSVTLLEAARIARHGIVIKDNLREGPLAGLTLASLDWLGNFGDGVPMPYAFLTRREWQGTFFKSHLQLVSMTEKLDLYLPPARWLFDRHLHFVAYLTPKDA